MNKLDIFIQQLSKLKQADFQLAFDNEIYRLGVVIEYETTFKYACEAIKGFLRVHGLNVTDSNSPREILQLGYKHGFVNDSAVWLSMLKKRNISVHIYDENEVDEMLLLIRDGYIPAFSTLRDTLEEKLSEVEDEWN